MPPGSFCLNNTRPGIRQASVSFAACGCPERMPIPGKEPSRWVYLGKVYVLPDFRNSGIGAQLVETAIEFSQGIKAARMVLSPSPASRNFYARLGFQPAAELNILRFWSEPRLGTVGRQGRMESRAGADQDVSAGAAEPVPPACPEEALFAVGQEAQCQRGDRGPGGQSSGVG